MDRIYTVMQAVEEMRKSVEYYNIRIEAWKKVKRLYKKDGNAFQVLTKNFENCRFNWQYGSFYISVTFWGKSHGWETDEINLSCAAENPYTHKNGEKEEITPDFVEKCINGLIAKYTANMEKDAAGAEMIERQIAEITPELDKIRGAIEAAKEVNSHYVLQAYIKEYLRIL